MKLSIIIIIAYLLLLFFHFHYLWIHTLYAAPSAPPTDIRIFVVSSTQLLIEWGEIPSIDQNGVITQYQVLYEPLNTYGGLINNDSVLVNGLSTVLIELEEDTAYNVSVRAYTSVGPGPYSEPVTNSTLMDGEYS